MKKLILFICIIFCISCSDDCNDVAQSVSNTEYTENTCYSIFSVGSDKDGDYIIIGTNHDNPMDRKRYKVTDYKTYLGRTTICNLNNL
jgi:hypothetical protein